jgi:hypothetical protein
MVGPLRLKSTTNLEKKPPQYRVFEILENRFNKNGTIMAKPMCHFVHGAHIVSEERPGTLPTL